MKQNIIIITIGIIALASIVMSIWLFTSKENTGYVSVQQVYDQFEYKKELEKEYNSIKEKRNRILDSLRLKVQNMQHTAPDDHAGLQALKKAYFMKQRKFEEENQRLSQNLNEKILNQLNQYVKNYGQKHGYDYIFGTMSDGSLMHANETKNITNNVIDYINKQYHGSE